MWAHVPEFSFMPARVARVVRTEYKQYRYRTSMVNLDL